MTVNGLVARIGGPADDCARSEIHARSVFAWKGVTFQMNAIYAPNFPKVISGNKIEKGIDIMG